jgi:hypothetical protein
MLVELEKVPNEVPFRYTVAVVELLTSAIWFQMFALKVPVDVKRTVPFEPITILLPVTSV